MLNSPSLREKAPLLIAVSATVFSLFLTYRGFFSLTQLATLAIAFLVCVLFTKVRTTFIWFCLAVTLGLSGILAGSTAFGAVSLGQACSMFVLLFLLLRSETLAASPLDKYPSLGSLGLIAIFVVSVIANPNSQVPKSWLVPLMLVLFAAQKKSTTLPSANTAMLVLQTCLLVFLSSDSLLAVSGKAFLTGNLFNSGRFLGQLGDYEISAELYGLAAVIAMTSIATLPKEQPKTIYFAILTMSLALLALTQTRGPFIAGGVSLISFLILRQRSRARAQRKNLLLTLTSVVFSIFLIANIGQNLAARFANLDFENGFSRTINRAGVWGYFTSLGSFKNVPLLGNGLNYPYEEIGTYPHSLYLWLIWTLGYVLSSGLIGLAALLLIFLIRNYKASRQFGGLCLVALLYFLVDEAKIEFTRSDSAILLFCGLGALLVAGFRTEFVIDGDCN